MNRLGIDIGRVIIGPTIDGVADTRFIGTTFHQALQTPPAPRAFDVIAQLTTRFGGQVWLVSKCGPNVQAKSRAWLDHVDFWGRTGVPRGQVRFCRKRRDKADHARELGLTHFIDDRVDVLTHLRGLVDHLLLFGEEWVRAKRPPLWADPVGDWDAVEDWFAQHDLRAPRAANRL